MADSDDEYDRRRRDKFRRERSDYDRSRERDERRRDDWSDREWDRGRERRSREYRDYDRSRRERFSPPRHDMSPPQKRMRRDCGYDMPYSGTSGGPAYGPPQPWGHPDMHVMQHPGIPIQARLGNLHDVDLGTPTPVMKTFKEFLLSLEDTVDETEAVRRYNEYKLEFRRQQMQDFFLAHKDEEWFRSKYHPDEVGRHKQESLAALRNRLNAFLYLVDNSWLTEILLDVEKAPSIIKVLDAAVIKMEGGTEIDLKILDEEEEQAKREAAKKEAAKKEEGRTSDGAAKPAEEKEASAKTDTEKEGEVEEKPAKPEVEEEKKVEKEEPEREIRKSTKRKRKHSGDSDDGSDSESGSGSEPSSPKPERGSPERESPERETRKSRERESPEMETRKSPERESPERETRKSRERESPERETRKSRERESPESQERERRKSRERESRETRKSRERESRETRKSRERESRETRKSRERESRETRKSRERESPENQERETRKSRERESRESRKSRERESRESRKSRERETRETRKSRERESRERETPREKESQGQNGREDSPKKEEEEKPKEKPKEDVVKPRPLHKTCSLFMRNVAPNISKAEITALCKRYPGFLRVALSDPQPERRFLRKGYVTFDRGVNIKEICWNLQNIRLRDCELSPVVNRELSWRIRHVNGITQHRPILRNDIKLAAKLIHALDERGQLWKETQDGQEVAAQNPILKNITDYLIDEVSAEEEDLLWGSGRTGGAEPPKEGNPTEITVERDDKLIKVLDKLLLYLRIVHSVDYYITCDYPSEDEMPTRCGIMHVRGPIPPNRVSHREVADWQKTFEEKLAPLFAVRESLSEEEALKIGKKDPEQEVEKFVTANTQELGKEKWLCPLSGKKFKGPEFVRKHIFNKHAEKIEEVKKEVVFFNNFLIDTKRPALPEVKPIQPPVAAAQGLAPGLLYPHQGPQALLQYNQPRPQMMGYGAPQFPPNPYGAGRGYDAFRGQGVYPKPRNRMMRGDPRSIIEYRDLDAPEDVDFF